MKLDVEQGPPGVGMKLDVKQETYMYRYESGCRTRDLLV